LQVLSIVMVEESCVGQECRREQNISKEASHLLEEALRRALPTDSFCRKILNKLLRALDFLLDLVHLGLDVLNLSNELAIVEFVLLDVGL
jgi:hypothetical protein